jgi:hypothetical protein
MRLFGWLSKTAKKTPAKIATDEVNEFLTRLKGTEERHLGIVARQVAHIALRWHEKGVYLHEPEEALRSSPGMLWTLEEEIIQMQRHGRQSDVPGRIVWAHTLRAIKIPEIKGMAVEMWGHINRGFGYALNSDLIAEEYITGALLDVRLVFLRVPTGFEK